LRIWVQNSRPTGCCVSSGTAIFCLVFLNYFGDCWLLSSGNVFRRPAESLPSLLGPSQLLPLYPITSLDAKTASKLVIT